MDPGGGGKWRRDPGGRRRERGARRSGAKKARKGPLRASLEESPRNTHLFEYDGAGAWKMALLMSDTCSAHEDSKGSSPRILSSLVFLPRPAQKLPHISTPPNTESARDARRDGRVNYRAAPTVFTRVCVIRTPFPREHTLRANPRRRSATGGALTVPTDATFRARCGERERGLSNLCRIFGPPDDSERDRGDFRRIRVPRRRGWSPDFAKKRRDRSTEPSLLLARPHARLDCAVRFPPPPSANNVTQE